MKEEYRELVQRFESLITDIKKLGDDKVQIVALLAVPVVDEGKEKIQLTMGVYAFADKMAFMLDNLFDRHPDVLKEIVAAKVVEMMAEIKAGTPANDLPI